MECRICGNLQNHKVYKIREMMFGLQEIFDYFQCDACGCLQILTVPEDMSRYYPDTYYSHSQKPKDASGNMFIRKIKELGGLYLVSGRGSIGRLINSVLRDKFRTYQRMVDTRFPGRTKKNLLHKNSHILDVGCGAGVFLHFLCDSGFKHALGIDPYLKEDIIYKNGLRVLKKYLDDLQGQYDLIMFHHSFEHAPNPLSLLRHASRLLKEGGVCLIRIPIVDSYAWEHYRENWVQIDAPRHFFLHSLKSIKLLSEKVGLAITDIVYDSTAFQFWGSEQYVQQLPLKSEKSYSVNRSNSLFSNEQIESFEKQAKKMNSQRKGDQAAFYLSKSTGR